MLKSIFLPATAGTSHLSATELALNLSHSLGARLTACFIKPDPRASVPFMGEGLTAETIQALCDASEKEGEQGAADFLSHIDQLRRQHTYPDHRPVETLILCGAVSDHAGRRARLHDLTICPQPDPQIVDTEEILHDVLFRSGRLLMMVPAGTVSVGRHALIAWNGSAECARAVGASLPLLLEAQSISLLQVGSLPAARPDAQELLSYLETFGLKPVLHKIDSGSQSAAEAIQDAADKINADYLVLGAYSHSRWREIILGGVTRSLIHTCRLPLVMSH